MEQSLTPGHIACIMDGNGRWAASRGADRIDGHAAGEAAILATIDAALDLGVRWLTLFAFSTENWDRPQYEVDFLMEFNSRVIRRHGRRFHNQGVRVRYLGRSDERIPDYVIQDITGIEALTRENRKMTLTFAFDYGGRRDIVRAAQSLIDQKVPSSKVTEALFSAHFQAPDLPDADLVIRTSGEFRLSNFLLWQAAYSELVFLDVLWPDFRARHLREAIDIYSHRNRRFGKVG
jgi:undecaprenyl diphosphate synthase